jgi:hypothetical protein
MDPAAESELMFTHLCCVFRWATTVAGYRNPDSPSGRPERSRLPAGIPRANGRQRGIPTRMAVNGARA